MYTYIQSIALTSAVFVSGIALGEYEKVAMVSLNSEHGETFFFASFSTSSAGICKKHTHIIHTKCFGLMHTYSTYKKTSTKLPYYYPTLPPYYPTLLPYYPTLLPHPATLLPCYFATLPCYPGTLPYTTILSHYCTLLPYYPNTLLPYYPTLLPYYPTLLSCTLCYPNTTLNCGRFFACTVQCHTHTVHNSDIVECGTMSLTCM